MQGPGLLTKTLSLILPFYAGQLPSEEFSYNLNGTQLTLEDIKHGILRGNKRSPNGKFVPWPKTNPKASFVVSVDPFVVLLFLEDSGRDALQVPIEVFQVSNARSRLT
jgi:hypothetical protein